MNVGVLLIHLGTPRSPDKKDVIRYLKEFLMDPFVIDIPFFFRWILVHLIIIPFRSKKSSHAYKSIWTEEGSPLLVHCVNLCKELQKTMGSDYQIELGMRYGEPSIEKAFRNFSEQKIKQLIVVPLYPQYAEATTLTAIHKIKEILRIFNWKKPVLILKEFYKAVEFTGTQAELIKENIKENEKYDHFLFSFHGLPERHVDYQKQCYITAKEIAENLGLSSKDYSVGFQSRLGRKKWLGPSTQEVLRDVLKLGKKNVVLACPSFTADCLETLEEIGVSLKSDFTKLGGERFYLATCLNSHNIWIKNLSKLVKRIEIRDQDLEVIEEILEA